MRSISLSEAARRIGCSAGAVRNMIDDGRIRGEHGPLGRIVDADDCERVVKERAERGERRLNGARGA